MGLEIAKISQYASAIIAGNGIKINLKLYIPLFIV